MDEGSTPTGNASPPDSFVARHWQKLAALFFWLVLLGGYQIFAWRAGLSPLGAVRELAAFLSENPLGWLAFVVVYTLRPLVLFPATLLTIAAGFVFGPVLGSALALVGSNASAMLAYVVGRFFGWNVLEAKDGFIAKYTRPLRENSFETILVMRFVFVPYDIVNYASGFLKVRPTPFVFATLLGSIPATVSISLFGASVGPEALTGTPSLDWRILAASAALFVASIALSQFLKRRKRNINTTENTEKEKV